MTKSQSFAQERAFIFGSPAKRRYGAQLDFQVQHVAILGNLQDVTFLLEDGVVATLAPTRQPSWEAGCRFRLSLEGFATATLAEEQGRRLSQAILWTAISLNCGLRLNYQTLEPAAVFDRLASKGSSMYVEGTVSWSPEAVQQQFIKGYGAPQVDPQCLLSMEIFCSSALEASDRAKFFMAVSAFEPLAAEDSLGTAVGQFVDDCLARLKEEYEIDARHRTSLEGRINQLRRESIRQALLRIVAMRLPGHPTAAGLVDAAYALRSELVHEGGVADYDVDLAAETRKISSVLRAIYARTIGMALQAQPQD